MGTREDSQPGGDRVNAVSPSLHRLREQARSREHLVLDYDADFRFPVSRPAWADPDNDLPEDRLGRCQMRSEFVEIPITRHPGKQETVGTSDRLRLASLRLQISQYVLESEPYIGIERLAARDVGDGFGVIAGSHAVLTLDEAAQLAHTLLLLIEVATDSGGQGDQGCSASG